MWVFGFALVAALTPTALGVYFDHVVATCDDLDKEMGGRILVLGRIICEEMKVSEGCVPIWAKQKAIILPIM